MQKTLKELAPLVGAEVAGDGDVVITGVAGIKEATEGHLTFLANPKYVTYLASTQASAVIVSPQAKDAVGKPLLVTENPYLAFAKALTLFHEKKSHPPGISERAFVASSAKIGKDVSIYPHVYIGNNTEIGDQTVLYPGVVIGDDCQVGEGVLIYPNAAVYDGTQIGNRVIIGACSVVGHDGFGYAKDG